MLSYGAFEVEKLVCHLSEITLFATSDISGFVVYVVHSYTVFNHVHSM